MALGDQKCNRHPKHMANACPHHGRPQEETCYCDARATAFVRPDSETRGVDDEADRAQLTQADGKTRSIRLESMITLDGVDFMLSVEGACDPFKAQQAASRLKAATTHIGAVWS
jgi:hypothetical protein